MTERPVRIDRTKALKDAEVALIAHRLAAQRPVIIPNADGTTEVQVVVDAALAALTPDPLSLTPAEAALAVWALRHVRGWPDGRDAVAYIGAQRALEERLAAALTEGLD